MNKDSDILTTVENGILKVVLNRPKKKNALTWVMYNTLADILNEANQNKDVYMVVLTGSGSFFSSGNDIAFTLMNNDGSTDTKDAVMAYKKFVDALITYPKLLVAIVNGPAIGIAVTMLPFFDMVYASDTAYFHTPFTSLGLTAEGCSTYTFPRLMGYSKAGDMLYLGYKMNAHEAKQVGLVSQVYKHSSLDDVWTYLNKVSTLSLQSILAIKQLVRKWNEKFLLDLNEQEAQIIASRAQSEDVMERMINFMSRKNKL